MKHFAPLERLEEANVNYLTHAINILELAKKAYRLYLEQEPTEKRKLLKVLLSNCTFDSGKLYPTDNRPFDLLVKSKKNNDWLTGQDVVRTVLKNLEEGIENVEIPSYPIPASLVMKGACP